VTTNEARAHRKFPWNGHRNGNPSTPATTRAPDSPKCPLRGALQKEAQVNNNDGRWSEENRYLNVKFIVGVVLTGLVVLFLIQNVGSMEVRFLLWSFVMPRSLLLFIVLVIGIVAGWFWHSLSLRRRATPAPRSDL
jgi:uncharacterized integral membrane protein